MKRTITPELVRLAAAITRDQFVVAAASHIDETNPQLTNMERAKAEIANALVIAELAANDRVREAFAKTLSEIGGFADE